jgi:hypothetical protein
MKYVLITAFLFSVGASAEPACSDLNSLYKTYYHSNFKIAWPAADFACDDNNNHRLAKAYYELSQVSPTDQYYYKTAAGLTRATVYQKDCGPGYAATMGQNGVMTLCDKYFEADAIWRSSSLFHEVAHARLGDPSHVICDHGDVKGKFACDASLTTAMLDGSGYNFQLWYLRQLAHEATRHSLDKAYVKKALENTVYNRFNYVAAGVAETWTK